MQSLISRLPDNQAMQELVRLLKACSLEYAVEIIRLTLVDENSSVRYGGAKLAAKVIHGAPNFLNLLDVGLARKDVSGIRHLLAVVIKAIGVNKVLKHLVSVASEHPDWIVFVWYHLVPIVKREGNKIEQLREVELITDRALINKTQEIQDFWKSTKSALDY